MKTPHFFPYAYIKILVCFFSFSSVYAQWPQWRGVNRDGISLETNLLKVWPSSGPKLIWSNDTIGDGFSSAAIFDGMVYTTGKRDSVEILTAMDLSGTLKWQQVVGRASKEKEWPQSRCTPTIYEKKVYAVTVFGDVACFDCKTGHEVWKMPAFEKLVSYGYNQNGIAESPLVIDDKLIITPCGPKTTMVALNRFTGNPIWISESVNDTTSFTSPVFVFVNGKKAIFTSTLNYDLIIDFNTGNILWKEKHVSGIIPIISNNQIYQTGEYQKGGALCSWAGEKVERTVIWRDTIKADIIGGGVLLGDKLIISGNSKGLYCLDFKTGNLLCKYDKINYCALTAAEGMLYAYEDRGGKLSLIKVNETGFELVSSFKPPLGKGPSIAHLSISNGMLFVRHGNVLMAYDIRHS